MNREPVSKFNLAAAFKALEDIEIPAPAKKIKPRITASVKESFSKNSAVAALVEDYYDLSIRNDLNTAQEERKAEVAAAKLARIERIVDLNAESPEDLLPSYVGKLIVQCPQCLTLFYKDQDEIAASEENPEIVNVDEACQHCGNTSGYNLIGKVGAIAEEEEPIETADTDPSGGAEDITLDAEVDTTNETTEEASEAEDINIEDIEFSEDAENDVDVVSEEDLGTLETEDEADETDEADEGVKESLNEEIELCEDIDLDAELKDHEEYIEYLRKSIEDEEKTLVKAKNEQVKASIQKRIDSLKADLEAALPNSIRDKIESEDLPEPDEVMENAVEDTDSKEPEGTEEAEDNTPKAESLVEATISISKAEMAKLDKEVEEATKEVAKYNIPMKAQKNSAGETENVPDFEAIPEAQRDSAKKAYDRYQKAVAARPDRAKNIIKYTDESLTKDAVVKENLLEDITPAEFDALLNSKEFKTPISNAEVAGYMADLKELEEGKDAEIEAVLDEIDEIDEDSIDECLTNYLTETYQNVKNFRLTSCGIKDSSLVLEGIIKFNSGKEKPTTFTFKARSNKKLIGTNVDFSLTEAYKLGYKILEGKLVARALNYKYHVGKTLVEGFIRR